MAEERNSVEIESWIGERGDYKERDGKDRERKQCRALELYRSRRSSSG